MDPMAYTLITRIKVSMLVSTSQLALFFNIPHWNGIYDVYVQIDSCKPYKPFGDSSCKFHSKSLVVITPPADQTKWKDNPWKFEVSPIPRRGNKVWPFPSDVKIMIRLPKSHGKFVSIRFNVTWAAAIIFFLSWKIWKGEAFDFTSWAGSSTSCK